MILQIILADILLIARIFPCPWVQKYTTQLVKYPPVLSVKPSNKVYLFLIAPFIIFKLITITKFSNLISFKKVIGQFVTDSLSSDSLSSDSLSSDSFSSDSLSSDSLLSDSLLSDSLWSDSLWSDSLLSDSLLSDSLLLDNLLLDSLLLDSLLLDSLLLDSLLLDSLRVMPELLDGTRHLPHSDIFKKY